MPRLACRVALARECRLRCLACRLTVPALLISLVLAVSMALSAQRAAALEGASDNLKDLLEIARSMSRGKRYTTALMFYRAGR
jgi:hypothetical protein